MDQFSLTALRLASQHISLANFTKPEEVVRDMLAMQAQDYPGALWAVALRTKNATQKDVEKAIANRRIVRTWPMRGTLHFMHADDTRWMLQLLGSRGAASARGRRLQLGLTDNVMDEVEAVVRDALSGGKPMSRSKIASLLRERVKGLALDNSHVSHIFRNFGQRAITCFGPHEGKQPTFVLLDDWLPKTPEKPREEALGELARRYFTSHGPALLTDLAGWASINQGDAKLGLELAKNDLVSEIIDGKTYYFSNNAPKPPTGHTAFLLPGFDEYMLGYKDRSAALHADHANNIVPGGNGMFLSTIVVDSQVVGTWKKTIKKADVVAEYLHFDPKKSPASAGLAKALARYKQFAL